MTLDGVAGVSFTGQTDTIDSGMSDESTAGCWTQACNQIKDAGRQIRFCHALREKKTGEGRLLGWLEDDGVACGDAGTKIFRGDDGGKIPRRDDSPGSDGDFEREQALIGVARGND